MTQTRRSFLAVSAAAASAVALSGCQTGKAPRGQDQKLKIGMIGVANRAADNLAGVAATGEEIAALCDVDANYLTEASKKFPTAKTFRDYRELLQMPGLDAVVVSTPDHSHYPASKMAMQRNLDVYCEKPLTHTVAQARRLTTAARERGLITQLGTQIHSWPNYRRAIEIVRSGALGTIGEVHVFVNGTNWSAKGRPEPKPVPPNLDWDLWIGPAFERSFNEGYHPAGWRRWWAFGGGTTADMACHYMDLAFWALNLEAPTALRADGPEPDAEGAPEGMSCWYAFPAGPQHPALELTWWCGNLRPGDAVLKARGIDSWSNGVLFVGDKGWLIADYTRLLLGPKEKFADFKAPPPSIADSPGHYVEWVNACKARTLPPCHFGYSGLLTESVLLANAAFRGARGERLLWRRDELEIIGKGGAQQLLDEPLRSGWAV
jgi:predicted dehydrogenase